MRRVEQFKRVHSDSAVMAEIHSRRPEVRALIDGPGPTIAAAGPWGGGAGRSRTEFLTEAIVLREGRPTLLARDDSFELPQLKEWKARLLPTKSKIDRAIRSVGRLEVGFSAAPYVGTAWMIAPGVAVTNRHVAMEFGRKSGREFTIRANPIGQPFAPRVDFKEEYVAARPFEVSIVRILYIADLDDDAPDLAFVELSSVDDRALPPPIPLFDGEPESDQVIVAIGYPAEDPRNDADDQARLFGGVYDVKRVAPGLVMERLSGALFSHDCTTLGGSSGSAIIDVETGAALGLHFAGDYLDANYAVSSPTLATYLGRLRRGRATTVNARLARKPEPERTVSITEVASRKGYDSGFLGSRVLAVPLPKMARGLAALAVPVDPARRGAAKFLLDYTHYSVVMHAERRFPIFTAVNIEGSAVQRIKRSGAEPWALDPRIPPTFQHNNVLYAGNDLDRGHVVRRIDPAWGTDAATGEQDSFFFTNCTPQHKDFNRLLWLSLEDYVLDNAATEGFRACVFSGPVFAEDDRSYRDALLPGAYWKVVVMVNAITRSLSATGYLVSQADLITDLEFAYGQMKTYQVPVTTVEAKTGLTFGRLSNHDPIGSREGLPVREIGSASDITI